MDFERNIQGTLQTFVDEVVRLAKIEIGAKRKARRSNGKIYYKRIDNTGTLRNSLRGEVKAMPNSFEADILMEEYGEWVDKGRGRTRGGGTGKVKEDIYNWIKNKPIRLRDANGNFAKVKDYKIRSLAYVIARKIHKKGIEPTNFLTDPFERKFKDLPQEIIEAYGLDVEDFLRFTIDKLNKEYKV